jgi:nucleotide-binding universal stress UspA family protein
MFKKILLPLDLTDKHQPAIDIAAHLARQSKGQVTLLHVIELIAGLPLEEEKDFYGKLERTAQAHLERFRPPLARRKIACQAEVRFGSRAAEVARHAEEHKVDLIILSAPMIDPKFPAAGWGSLSYKVGILARCPVLLVKGT